MKKKKLLIIISTIFILLLIGLALYFVLGKEKKSKKEENIPVPSFSVSEDKRINMCVSPGCLPKDETIYSQIELDYKSNLVQLILNKINQETDKYYEEVLTSNMDSVECQPFKEVYKYNTDYGIDYDLYHDEDFVSIKVNRSKSNLCTGELEIFKPEIYLIDKKEDKEITAKEFMKKKNIDNDDLKMSIEKNIDSINKYNNTSYTYENTFQNGKQDIRFFYSYSGELYILYFQNEDQNYYVTSLIQ